jgi:predicted hotdog family 3-hydroxylacyl-ACP dehydratase
LFFFQYLDCGELIRPDLIESDPDAHFQRRPQVERAPQQQTRLGGLCGIELVQRAVAAAATIVGRIRAQPRVTEFVAAKRPMN